MPPSGGEGANTALHDAGLLVRYLTSAASGETSIGTAVKEYEKEMLDYAWGVIRNSHVSARSFVVDGYVVSYLLGIFLKIVHFFLGERNE